jgi:catechol 2,3-dioxygenase-like lactoylglutathione lyase family enzyme
MKEKLLSSHCVFPVPDIERTAEYYERVLGFRVVRYLEAKEPHVCLYRDATEIILTLTNGRKASTNRELYGYGYDAYFIAENQKNLEEEFRSAGADIVRPLSLTDYRNREFVVEDIDGRWLGFGKKED